MLEHIYYFIQGISSFKYNIPIYLQIIAFITIGVFATCILLIFNDTLNNSIFKDTYMIYYTILIINIINIIVILFYYKSKTGTFIGLEGIKGNKGLKGNIGTNIDCSLCIHNLYMQKINRYDIICKLNNTKYISRLLGENINNDQLLNELINNNNFNYEQFASSLLIDGFDLNNTSVLKIFNYINSFEFLLYNNINENLGSSMPNITGYFKRPITNIGNYCLGDTAIGNENDNIITYGLNGDIIMPNDIIQLCTFTTITDNDKIEHYGIYKMIPPKIENINNDDIPEDKRNLSKQYKNDEYVSLGHIIAPINENNPDTKLYACIKRSCCKKIKNPNLKLLFIYPAIYTNNNLDKSSNLDKTSNIEDKTDDNIMGMFSVWRTPLNTIFVKYIDNNKLIDNKILIEQLYLNLDTGEISENLYTKYGTIKKVIKERIKLFLTKINLDKIVILGILFNHTFEYITKELKNFYNTFINNINSEIPNTSLLKKLLDNKTNNNITYNDIHIIINEIENLIKEKKQILLKNNKQQLLEEKKKHILGIGEKRNKIQQNKYELSFNLIKRFETIKTKIKELSINIENSNTLYDIVEILFTNGLDYIINIKDLTYSQKIILYLCYCLIKPSENIYTIKNKCLVYEQIDEQRIQLENNINDTIKNFNMLRHSIGENATQSCGGIKNLNYINNIIENTYEKIIGQINHISNALEKLNNSQLDEFTNGQLEFILYEIKMLILTIEKKCL